LQAAREEECNRIARSIHDELGQALTGLKMDLAWLQRHVDDGQAVLLERMNTMSMLIDDTVRSVRRIATELRPAILDDLGLVAAIEWQSHEFELRTGIRVTFVADIRQTVFSPDSAIALFRILQEALTNVARHAHAGALEVQLEERKGWLVLTVHDDGRGITDPEITSLRSIGLLGMRERARLQNGTLRVFGSALGGTTVIARLPSVRSSRSRREPTLHFPTPERLDGEDAAP
jgi:signal transduction histidine kinase